MSKRNLLIVSTSTVHGQPYLSYLKEDVKKHFLGCTEIIFIPFARPGGVTWDAYTKVARDFFAQFNIEVKGIHQFDDSKRALENAQGVFTGGGNTFVLLKEMYAQDLLQVLRKQVADGMPYMGTSAGSNLTGMTVNNTNDMPIVYPPSFDAIGAVPFNINPHYLDPDPNSKHMGETRETRIKEYLVYNSIPVVGLREGSYLKVSGNSISLMGDLKMRIFENGKAPYEVESGSDISFLLEAKSRID
ncbi:MAG: dipeptidase E [Salibacteraceae bacterium]|jgi:dipeptidase E